jgi:hypothetical protein
MRQDLIIAPKRDLVPRNHRIAVREPPIIHAWYTEHEPQFLDSHSFRNQPPLHLGRVYAKATDIMLGVGIPLALFALGLLLLRLGY